MLLGIKWYQFIWNDDVRRLTKQPVLTAIIQLRRLTLFGHIMRMDDNADAKRILLASPPTDWRRQLGRPRINRIWKTPPYAPRSSRFGSEPPSVEDDVDVWRYAIVSYMPETNDCLLNHAVLCVVDLSHDTGIHVSDITATIQSLGLISVAADNHRYLILLVNCHICSKNCIFCI